LNYVFAYGSLAHPGDIARLYGRESLEPSFYRMGTLRGFRRSWSVGMDNTKDIPGYKAYYHRGSRRRPETVVFLNLEEIPGEHVNGLLLPVDEKQLERLDERERNYRRTNVSADSADTVEGLIWAYLGRREAIDRCRQGEQAGAAFRRSSYVERVEHAFRLRGPKAFLEYKATTQPTTLPTADLELVRISPSG